MFRKSNVQLLEWKDSPSRKPLVIRGARQVGKTWLMKDFGQKNFKKLAYINFESEKTIQNVFEQDFNIQRILLAIQIQTGVEITPGDTLIVFDEVQESKGALTSLKYFAENAPDYHIIAAGSLLGVAMKKIGSFPVGKVTLMDLSPLDFEEFLEAMGAKDLLDLLKSRDWEMIKVFKSKFIDLLKQYYFVGGMPEAVWHFSRNRNFQEVRVIQKNLLEAYEQDFSKHAHAEIVPRIRMVWNSIPSQLSKENKKFIYAALKHGARAKDFELALSWLEDSGLAYKVQRVSKPGIPLKAYEDLSAFKLFLLDIGLLGAMVDLDVKTILEGNRLFEEFKGAATEQYVLQQLMALGVNPSYWSADNGTSELDFIIQQNSQVIPIEVKAEENLKSKSLKVFVEKYKSSVNVRTSLSDFRREDWLVNIPLYGIQQISNI